MLLIEAHAVDTVANELNPGRLNALKSQGFDLQCNSRRHTANPRIFLYVGYYRSEYAGERDRGRLRRTLSNSQ